jgi:predicted CopG family antitoxin
MSKRTTILLADEVYQRLVQESVRRYKTTKGISKVANELLKSALRGEASIFDLIMSEKVAKTTTKEFEKFRRQLSKRFES